jgi:hypothetical protein
MHQAQVSYQMGQLTVLAENSSLNQILRDIAAKTGMKITGSIADQQVYGTYGPAAAAKVLAQLLEGSGNNMVLRESAANDPLELVLMPMQGTPGAFVPVGQPSYAAPVPQPSAPQAAYQAQQNYAPAQPQRAAQPQQVYSGPGGASQPVNNTQQAVPAANQTSQPAADVPQSPNGVRTPQQIFEQLQRLQQQKAQPPAPAQ